MNNIFKTKFLMWKNIFKLILNSISEKDNPKNWRSLGWSLLCEALKKRNSFCCVCSNMCSILQSLEKEIFVKPSSGNYYWTTSVQPSMKFVGFFWKRTFSHWLLKCWQPLLIKTSNFLQKHFKLIVAQKML